MESRRDLSSWKEIADYFDVSVRTVQHWEEQRGLPVRRLPGGGRGRVFASISELEAWKCSCAQVSGREDGAPGHSPGTQEVEKRIADASQLPKLTTALRALRVSRRTLYAIVGSVLVLSAAIAMSVRFVKDRHLAQWRVADASFIVFDARNDELWRKEFDRPLDPESYDRQAQNTGALPRFVDLDGDGEPEVLFPYRSVDLAETGMLICYSARGKERWRFIPGGAVHSQSENFDPIFNIRNSEVIARDGGPEKQLLVVSSHYLFYPTQIALLSKDGRLLRQYWHSGHIGTLNDTLRVIDFNRDGRDEIYLSGVSNGYRQATLVVLDPGSFEGAASEVDGRHQLQGFPPGKEMRRVLFPRSCMNRATHEYNNALRMNFTRETLVLSVREAMESQTLFDVYVFYTLGPDLSFRGFATGDLFEATHAQMYREGKLDHAFDPTELDAFHNLTFLTPSSPSATSAKLSSH